MDFFEQQDCARRKTTTLVVYFVLAVVLIILGVYGAVASILLYLGRSNPDATVSIWNPQLFLLVAGSTLALVILGTLYKIATLKSGGYVVAQALGGVLIDPDTTDQDERKVLHVVEEMAIASGTAVPPVYVMPQESAINAFAAGFTPADAVIGVTQGCITQMTRDELQGVIAHEFSHILNGDMRLNIRLMGILHGILLIGMMGYIILRGSLYGSRRHSRNQREGNNAAIPLIGLALVAIGFVGLFFGKLIKSAVSRQREFLADASAVQFTRNPNGIACALKRIGASAEGSKIQNPHAQETSHLFFSNGIGAALFNAMATHPPLAQRIKRIDPAFDGNFQVKNKPKRQAQQKPPKTKAQSSRFDPTHVLHQIGTPGVEHILYAAALLESLPHPIKKAVHNPFGARAVIYALLLDPSQKIRENQLNRLAAHADKQVVQLTQVASKMVNQLEDKSRLPVVELAIPALKQLSDKQHDIFMANLKALIEADDHVSLFEYALYRMLKHHLPKPGEKVNQTKVRYIKLGEVIEPCSVLLSALAHGGHDQDAAIEAAFNQGAQSLGTEQIKRIRPKTGFIDLKRVDQAIQQLKSASPQVKKQIISACLKCVGADSKVTVSEFELFRAIADSLDCPIPPWIR